MINEKLDLFLREAYGTEAFLTNDQRQIASKDLIYSSVKCQ